ncbi:MAG: hypothetical protein ACK5Y8_09035 [Betaproteobacteria bacterium]|jgi:hypothetical protein|nr:hypothetical protein [Paracoccaceae bacterium]
MDRDFTPGTELTEGDVSGDRHFSARQPSAAGSSGWNLNAATNGGWGLVLGALALWAVWWLFPGNQRQQPHTLPPPALSEAPEAVPPGTPTPNGITVEIGANGIVIKDAPTAASTPSSGGGKKTDKAAPAASPPARSHAASAAADSQPVQ